MENVDTEEIEAINEFTKSITTETIEMMKKVNPAYAEASQKVIEFRKNLTQESDRGIALMGTAYIDERLKVLIEKYLIEDNSILKTMFDFSGPLGTFSSRLMMAYSLGLIPKNIFNNSNILRKIRNDFAHVSRPISFDEEPVKSRCYSLNIHGIDTKSRAKARFTRTIMTILLEIETSIISVERCNVKEDFDIELIKKSVDKFKYELIKKGYKNSVEKMDS